jgi:hypothetical protein
MQTLLRVEYEKILLLASIIFREDYHGNDGEFRKVKKATTINEA